MGHDSMPRYVGLDVHKDSIAIAVAEHGRLAEDEPRGHGGEAAGAALPVGGEHAHMARGHQQDLGGRVAAAQDAVAGREGAVLQQGLEPRELVLVQRRQQRVVGELHPLRRGGDGAVSRQQQVLRPLDRLVHRREPGCGRGDPLDRVRELGMLVGPDGDERLALARELGGHLGECDRRGPVDVGDLAQVEHDDVQLVAAGHEVAQDRLLAGEEQVALQPVDEAAVAAVVAHANDHRIPVTARGAGTGLSGACVARSGGVLISFDKMNRILEIDTENHMAVVQPAGAHAVVGGVARHLADGGEIAEVLGTRAADLLLALLPLAILESDCQDAVQQSEAAVSFEYSPEMR